MQRLQRGLTAVLVIGLLAAATAAFAVVQDLKTRPPALLRQKVQFQAFSPVCGCEFDRLPITFTLRRPGTIDAEVIDATSRAVVRRLLPPAPRRGEVILEWDGRRDDGQLAPDGTYQVRVGLLDERRRVTLPRRVALDTRPPEVRATVPPPGAVLRLGAAAAGGSARVRVAADEPVWVTFKVVRIGRRRVPLDVLTRDGRAREDRRRAVWNFVWRGGRTGNGTVSPGTFILGYEVADLAGNRVIAPARYAPGQLDGASVVRVVTLEVDGGGRLDGRPGTAELIRTRLAGAAGSTVERRRGAVDTLRFRRPRRPGFYRLDATQAGATATGFQAEPGASRILVVAPTYTWQYHNRYDAAGDGFPDIAPAPLSLARPIPNLAPQLPAFETAAIPVIARRPGAGAITDRRIEVAGVPSTARVVVLAELEVWTAGLRDQLLRFTSRGGRVLVVGRTPERPATRSGSTIRVASNLDPLELPADSLLPSVDAALAAADEPERAP